MGDPAGDCFPFRRHVMQRLAAQRRQYEEELIAARTEHVGGASKPPAPAAPAAAAGMPRTAAEVVRDEKFWVPMMEAAEMAKATVGMDELGTPEGAARLREVMAGEGWALVTGVTNAKENAVLEKAWTADLAALTAECGEADAEERFHPEALGIHAKLAEGDATAWPSATIVRKKWVDPEHGLHHGSYAWLCRLHPNVRACYAALLEVPQEELCVGCDYVFFEPRAPPPKTEDRYWMHNDYNKHVTALQATQGVLYTWPSEDPGCATTVIWPRSHTDVFESVQDDPMCKDCFNPPAAPGKRAASVNHCLHLHLEDTLRDKLVDGALAHAKRVPVPAGALVLWDGRLAHQGWAGGRRLACPVCYEAKSTRTEAARTRKVWLAATGQPSTHWASLGMVHTGQTGLLSSLSEHTAPADEVDDADDVKMPMYPTLLPWGVAPEHVDAWAALYPQLWKGSAKDSCEGFARGAEVAALLRPDVLNAL
eukprot:TRINITY_DN18835_c0_g1_i1.p1 TRINITY_DN18835_c0_g1~~TRINITY_DN18835_c0_g1_i1.p1  ORF type:complete len:481 (+),score=130.44 TRINITY_DN18835_c0_g1_i1:59-1501(+)